MHARRATLVLSILATIVLVAACGTSTTSNAPNQSGSAATPGGAVTTPGPGQTLGNIGGAASGLSNLSAYKVTMTGSFGTGPVTVELVKINGASPASSFSEQAGSISFRVIEIGADNWVDSGSGTFVKNSMPAGAVDEMMGAFDPGTIFANLSAEQDLSALENKGVESKNGVQAIHLHGDEHTQLPAGASPIPSGSTVDLWVAADGQFLVALEVVGFPGAKGLVSFSIEITNVNDSSLTVTPPS